MQAISGMCRSYEPNARSRAEALTLARGAAIYKPAECDIVTPMPIKWTDEQKAKACEEILARVRGGMSLSKACIGDDWIPPRQTFEHWCDSDADLMGEYARAREARADAIFEECLEISDRQGADVVTVDGVDVIDHNVIARNKLMIDTRRWMLGKMQPKKYGDKLELSGDEKSPLQIVIQRYADEK